MNKSTKFNNSILIFLGIFISLGISLGIILSINLLNKNSIIERKIIGAEHNQIIIGEEKILYVDLTKNAEDYEKINQIKKEKNNTNKETIIDKINEDTYNIEFNLEEKSVSIDGKEASISEIINNNEENLSNEEINKYIDENIVGDVEKNESNIKITNPYSTNTILIKTSNIEKIENAGNVQSVVKIADDIYNMHYLNSAETKEGYNLLKENDVVENVIKDYRVSILENEARDITAKTLEVSEGKSAWGVNDTGLELYKNKINREKNIPEIKVAVLDTGIRTTHEVFKNKSIADRLEVTDSYNYINKNTDITDNSGHGTMVAGIIAEATSNNVKIIPMKTMDGTGEGSLLGVIEAMYAVARKADVINLSLGINENEIDANSKQILEQALKSIYDSGVMIVCASGNDGEENVYYPASSEYTIAVGATTINKEIASFSNYGDNIDFVAPGKTLTLPYYTGDSMYNVDLDNFTKKNSGTSFAAPFVSSAIAMIKSENKNYTIDEVKNILKENAEDLGAKGKDKYYGEGLLNFNINMFNKPVITSVEVTDIGEKEIKIEASAVDSNKITNWAYTNSEIAPEREDEWRTFKNGGETVNITLQTFNDKDCYLWFKDEKGNITSKKAYSINILYGDVNDNGKIDPGDAMAMQKHIAAKNTESVRLKHSTWILDETHILIGDINNNKSIDPGDVMSIKRYIAAQNSEKVRMKHPKWLELR